MERHDARDPLHAEPAREGEFIRGPSPYRFDTLRESRVFVETATPVGEPEADPGLPPRLPAPIASYLMHSAAVIHARDQVGHLFDDYV